MYQLKIKAASLSAEARIIRAEEQREKRLVAKWKARSISGRAKALRNGAVLSEPAPPIASSALADLHYHRVNDVRKEARNAFLAYGFLKGRAYREMENFAWTQPNWDRVQKLAVRYSDGVDSQVILQRFAEWKDDGLGGVPPRFCESVQPGSMRRSGGCRNPEQSTYNADWIAMQLERNEADITEDLQRWVDGLAVDDATSIIQRAGQKLGEVFVNFFRATA